MYSDIDVTFHLSGGNPPSRIRVVNRGGMFQDRLTISTNGVETVQRKLVALLSPTIRGEAEVLAPGLGQPLVVRWIVSGLGKPSVVELLQGGVVLCRHEGQTAAEYAVALIEHAIRSPAIPEDRVRVEEQAVVEGIRNAASKTVVVAVEQFPLNNLHGSDVLTVEHEISRTASNEVKTEQVLRGDAEASAQLWCVIGAKIGASLSQQLGQTFGEQITRRQTLRFSVGPGKRVVYEVIWKRNVCAGEAVIVRDRRRFTVPFEAHFDLMYEVQSSQ